MIALFSRWLHTFLWHCSQMIEVKFQKTGEQLQSIITNTPWKMDDLVLEEPQWCLKSRVWCSPLHCIQALQLGVLRASYNAIQNSGTISLCARQDVNVCAQQENWQCDRFASSQQKGTNNKTLTIQTPLHCK